jgi:hypothetical protein
MYKERSSSSVSSAAPCSSDFVLHLISNVGALVLLARWLGMRIYNGLDELVDDLAAGLVADLVNLLDLGICVLLCVLFSLLVA